jgi:uncharacterized protein (DUF697 family)
MHDAIEQARAWIEADAPVIWLLGKTQTGKTSIVAEITGQAYDQIGAGYLPVTREARLYAFPETQPVLRLLDTRGLGDSAGYDPRNDLAAAQGQAHLILAVMRVDDLEQTPILAALQQARRAHPQVPVLIAQTSLHRCYGRHDRHLEPYPFDGSEADGRRPGVPHALVGAMLAQRQIFRGVSGPRAPRFIPIDFTRPEQGIAPTDYGAEHLWDVLEEEIPELVARLKGLRDAVPAQDLIRRRIILPWAVAASAASAIPAPVIGGIGSASLQAAMVSQIARRCGIARRLDVWGEFVAALGAGFALGFGGRWVVQQGLKLGLGWGTAIVTSWTFAITWGIGEAALYYFSERAAGREPDRQILRERYRDGFRQARQHYAQRKTRPE